MNRVELIVRATAEPVCRSSAEGKTVVGKFTGAAERRFKKDGEPDADFINIVGFGHSAEFIERFIHKGTKIALCGRIQTGKYTDKDGRTVYTTEVVAEEFDFCEKKEAQAQGFDAIDFPIDGEELPFL